MFKFSDGERLCIKKITDNNGQNVTQCETYSLGVDGRKEIMIICGNMGRVGEKIYLQLAGNQNYIDGYICLNVDRYRILISIDEQSTDDNIRPVIEELIKQINSANIEGFRGINKTCWLSDRDPDYNEMVLDFTV